LFQDTFITRFVCYVAVRSITWVYKLAIDRTGTAYSRGDSGAKTKIYNNNNNNTLLDELNPIVTNQQEKTQKQSSTNVNAIYHKTL
jgi:hypothetical protein